MSRQFPIVNSTYGAPMGRHERPLGFPVRLFKVRLDSGGYDDGGAYWGCGEPIYCAQCPDGGQQFTRADSRLQAVVNLQIEASDMARPPRAEYQRLKALEQSGRVSARGILLLQELEELGF